MTLQNDAMHAISWEMPCARIVKTDENERLPCGKTILCICFFEFLCDYAVFLRIAGELICLLLFRSFRLTDGITITN